MTSARRHPTIALVAVADCPWCVGEMTGHDRACALRHVVALPTPTPVPITTPRRHPHRRSAAFAAAAAALGGNAA